MGYREADRRTAPATSWKLHAGTVRVHAGIQRPGSAAACLRGRGSRPVPVGPPVADRCPIGFPGGCPGDDRSWKHIPEKFCSTLQGNVHMRSLLSDEQMQKYEHTRNNYAVGKI